MRLIKCYIENFGKLSQFSYNFQPGLNTINQTNGWGKTTLVTFIKVMFYGLANYKGNDLANNERKKYLPWQGGTFGGNLEFEIKHKVYRVERCFGKTNAADSFKLIDLATGKPSQDYPVQLGESIFGIDAAGFERTLLIPQKVIDTPVNDTILNRLTNLVHGTNEKYNFETAEKILDDQRRYLSNQQKTGRLDRLNFELQNVTRQIYQITQSNQTLNAEQKSIADIDRDINDLRNAQANLQQRIGHQSSTAKPISKQLWMSGITCLGMAMLLALNICQIVTLPVVIPIGLFGFSLLALVICVVIELRNRQSVTSNHRDDLYQESISIQKRLDEQYHAKMQFMNVTQKNQDNLALLHNLEIEKQNLMSEINSLQQDWQAIIHAKEFLAAANQNLSTEFLAPMKQGLAKYLSILTGQNFNFVLDTDFNLTINEFGQTRSIDFYSHGYQNVFELCLRLALIETLYQQEKPFVMLDDPFVNLDANKLGQAKQLLQSLAAERQVLYFTCHASRC